MREDLKGMSRRELEKLKADVEKAIIRAEKDDLRQAREAAERAAAEHGFSLAELAATGGGRRRAGRPANVHPPKYRNPQNPEQTWSGRGRKPQWVKEAEESGADLSAFQI